MWLAGASGLYNGPGDGTLAGWEGQAQRGNWCQEEKQVLGMCWDQGRWVPGGLRIRSELAQCCLQGTVALEVGTGEAGKQQSRRE